MKKLLLLLLLGFVDSVVFGQNEPKREPFDKLEFDKVIAYNLNYDTIKNFPVDLEREINLKSNDFQFSNIRGVLGRRELSREQIGLLIGTLTDLSTYGNQHSACFIPRHGFTFF